ncbi:MAG: hypothetical protein ABXS93_08345 [Sulfurimonas sp.]
MCNFNNLNEDTKTLLSLLMKKSAENIGGTNFLLTLIESIRLKHSPLCGKKKQIASNNTIIQWNKVIFQDKADLLTEILVAHKDAQNREYNLLDVSSQKKKKKIINCIKTLKPIEFVVKPQNPNDGEGFTFGVFDTIDLDNDLVKFNPVFLTLFFCSVEFTKKALKYDVV